MGAERKVAVVTGASQGIGAALVKAYLVQLPCTRDGTVLATTEFATFNDLSGGAPMVSGRPHLTARRSGRRGCITPSNKARTL
jgi:hypothetical protein